MTPTAPAALTDILGPAMQLSYVVADLDAALRFWTEQLGVGPFVVIERATDDRIISYAGGKSRVEMSLAFAYVGEVQIELIAATSNDPTPWTDFLDAGREGLHHLGFWPDDYEASCAKLATMGFDRACQIETTDGEISSTYFEGPSHFGAMVELAPNSPGRVAYFAGIKSLSENWDGMRPIRRFATRAEYLASDDCPA
ncbi:VOC family protein [Celeribacter naphthalenivorans]|uniref:VOC family protein n=1 Tax=Celeribacter naphthalenivorans TaxID=1614694 RepID=UPI001CFA2A2F|nr:VOC family protein [Celeribacter naphthalenivorans]